MHRPSTEAISTPHLIETTGHKCSLKKELANSTPTPFETIQRNKCAWSKAIVELLQIRLGNATPGLDVKTLLDYQAGWKDGIEYLPPSPYALKLAQIYAGSDQIDPCMESASYNLELIFIVEGSGKITRTCSAVTAPAERNSCSEISMPTRSQLPRPSLTRDWKCRLWQCQFCRS